MQRPETSSDDHIRSETAQRVPVRLFAFLLGPACRWPTAGGVENRSCMHFANQTFVTTLGTCLPPGHVPRSEDKKTGHRSLACISAHDGQTGSGWNVVFVVPVTSSRNIDLVQGTNAHLGLLMFCSEYRRRPVSNSSDLRHSRPCQLVSSHLLTPGNTDTRAVHFEQVAAQAFLSLPSFGVLAASTQNACSAFTSWHSSTVAAWDRPMNDRFPRCVARAVLCNVHACWNTHGPVVMGIRIARSRSVASWHFSSRLKCKPAQKPASSYDVLPLLFSVSHHYSSNWSSSSWLSFRMDCREASTYRGGSDEQAQVPVLVQRSYTTT